MYRTCLSCASDLGSNRAIEQLAIGRRIAFDAGQGRLWVICDKCSKWNLVPFDSRLEAIETCEKLFRNSPTRFATDNIALARLAEGTTLVRIGEAIGEEFASWRYGEAFRKRRQRSMIIGAALGLPFAALMASDNFSNLNLASGFVNALTGISGGGAIAFAGFRLGPGILSHARLRLRTIHPVTAKRITLGSDSIKSAVLLTSAQVQGISIPFREGGGARDLLFTGREGEILASRILGKLNSSIGSRREVKVAVWTAGLLAQRAEEPSLYAAVAGLMGAQGNTATTLAHRDPAMRLALEMYSNEADERRFLTSELQLLERQWREAEQMAGIADGLALPDDSELALTDGSYQPRDPAV